MIYLYLAAITTLSASAAFSDIVITPFATNNVEVSKSYHQKLLVNIKSIIHSSENPDCAQVDVTYYMPSPIPADYSAKGIVNFNKQRRDLIDYTVANGGNVVFVAALGACASYENESTIAGCSGPGQAVVIEISGNAKQDAMALIHELGHSMNLAWGNPKEDLRRKYEHNGAQHTDSSHLSDKDRVMYYQLAGGTRLSNFDCKALINSNKLFKGAPTSGVLLMAEANQDDILAAREIQPAPETELLDLLSQVWLHEVPIVALKSAIQKSGGLEEIRQIIVSDSTPLLWRNALVALGYFGIEGDIELVRYFLNRSLPIPDGNERVVTEAKTAASFALGILTGRYASIEGAAFAFEITSPQFVETREDGTVDSVFGINLSGLSDPEKDLALTQIFGNAVIAQNIALALISDEQKAALFEQSAAFAEASEGGLASTRDTYLESLGLEPDYFTSTPMLNERIQQFKSGQIGVPLDSLGIDQFK